MKKRAKISVVAVDIMLVAVSYAITVLIKPNASTAYFVKYSLSFVGFIALWIIVSFINKKYQIENYNSSSQVYWSIIKTNLVIVALTALIMYGLRNMEYSRFIVFGTTGIATILEFFLFYLFYSLKYAKSGPNGVSRFPVTNGYDYYEETSKDTVTLDEKSIRTGVHIHKILREEIGNKAFAFVCRHISVDKKDFIIFSTTTRFNIDRLPAKYYKHLINIKRMNDIRFVNKFLESVNAKLPREGTFIGCLETKNQRKRRVLKKYPPVLNIIFYTFDFIIKRVFPKFFLTKKIYFFLTRGNNRVISKAEIIGRLYSCGFELIEAEKIEGMMYVAARKIKKPVFDENPTYGPFVKLRRVGKNGKIIYVYKLRTMHPFAEYIQDFVYEKNQLKEGGKFKNDFRITTLGRIFRKFWIDELPMLINFVKGEMKLVGVRPLSSHYFNLYDEDLQELRTKFKPGLIPPFYYDLPETLEEIQDSERKYLKSYQKHPFLTDWRYFWVAMKNIIIRRKRSS